ncbi:MAG: hypothetical protein FD163_1613 [Hyphomonadaceae bacterium]|nr:MAG: hypothetical protein FD128_328 [Hyphomonadaceae bacterium]KAF0184916.1 MAG: hypothetical protein FD163_1613 [Hyphomonadaceae bacterium]
MRLDNLKVNSLATIAWALFDAHGDKALGVADKAIYDLETEGMPMAADAWRGVKSMVEDVVLGRMDREQPTIH